MGWDSGVPAFLTGGEMRKLSQNFRVSEGVFVGKAGSTASGSIRWPQNRRFHLAQTSVLGPSDVGGGWGGRVLEMW